MVRRESDYAFRILAHMISRGGNGPITASQIASSEGIPTSFSQKILRRLTRAGILKARCGRGGGFVLARRPAKISMRDVVVAVQDGLRLGPCGAGPHGCPRRAGCPVTGHWDRLQRQLDASLARTTLADIVGTANQAHRSTGRSGSGASA